MRILIVRSGGPSGVTHRAEMDTEARRDAPHLHALAREAVTAGTRTPTLGTPAGYRYVITVDGRTVHCADPELSGAQQELVGLMFAECP